jgi:hypothetical protein
VCDSALQPREQTVGEHSQVLSCIDEDDGCVVTLRSLLLGDTRMSERMKTFLLRCLDKSPNTRPAAIDLMADPWLTGVEQHVCIPLHFCPARQCHATLGSTRLSAIAKCVFGRPQTYRLHQCEQSFQRSISKSQRRRRGSANANPCPASRVIHQRASALRRWPVSNLNKNLIAQPVGTACCT